VKPLYRNTLKAKRARNGFKHIISRHKRKEEGKKKQPKRDPILERGEKSVRTLTHVRHFPDLPGGEITIEVTSKVKHCTTQPHSNKEKSNDKNGFENKKESMVQKYM
jgi:hypothetical protein